MPRLPPFADHLVNLRLASKQMIRASKKAEGSEKEAKNKLKKAIEARNTEGARIYAQVRDGQASWAPGCTTGRRGMDIGHASLPLASKEARGGSCALDMRRWGPSRDLAHKARALHFFFEARLT